MTKKILACLLAVVTLLPLAVGCNQAEPEVTTEATTTTAATTSFPRTPLPSDDMESEFAEPAFRLARAIVKDYWSTGSLKSDITGGTAVVWGYASFMEAMAEAYRLFPDDKTIKKAYLDSLDNGIMKYKVSNATITTPNGEKHTVSYYNAGRGGKGDYYYDDDAWICIQFLNAYDLLKDEKYLKEAEETLEFLWTGWDDVLGGGIYWDKSYGGKNTCSNGPTAIAFLWAHQMTNNPDYLEKGKMIYDWTRETLMDKSSNLYSDNVNVEGKYEHWKSAYNQGTMIYAGAQLYEITGDETYLNQARATTNASVTLMFKGRGSAVMMQGNPIYKSWCVGWLVRGYIKFYTIDPKKNDTALTNMATVLKKNLKTKNKKGYYDPYFQTGDWSGESTTDVLQPCGMSSVMSLITYYETTLKNAK